MEALFDIRVDVAVIRSHLLEKDEDGDEERDA